MGRNYIYNQRKINFGNYHLQTKECAKFSNWKNSVENKCASFDRVSFVGLNNSTKPHFNAGQYSDEYCENPSSQPYDQIYEKYFTTDDLPISDLRSSENILNEWKDIQCKMINLSRKLRSKTFQDPFLAMVIRKCRKIQLIH